MVTLPRFFGALGASGAAGAEGVVGADCARTMAVVKNIPARAHKAVLFMRENENGVLEYMVVTPKVVERNGMLILYPQIYGGISFLAVKQTLKDVKEMLMTQIFTKDIPS